MKLRRIAGRHARHKSPKTPSTPKTWTEPSGQIVWEDIVPRPEEVTAEYWKGYRHGFYKAIEKVTQLCKGLLGAE